MSQILTALTLELELFLKSVADNKDMVEVYEIGCKFNKMNKQEKEIAAAKLVSLDSENSPCRNEANYLLAYFYFTGWYGAIEMEIPNPHFLYPPVITVRANQRSKAAKILEQNLAAGYAYSLTLLGLCYLYGDKIGETETLAANPTLAILYFKQAFHHPFAKYHLLRCYLEGLGVENDIKKAQEKYEELVTASYPPALLEVSNYYRYGHAAFKIDRNLEEANRLLHLAVNQNYIPALELLVDDLTIGANPNFEQALHYSETLEKISLIGIGQNMYNAINNLMLKTSDKVFADIETGVKACLMAIRSGLDAQRFGYNHLIALHRDLIRTVTNFPSDLAEAWKLLINCYNDSQDYFRPSLLPQIQAVTDDFLDLQSEVHNFFDIAVKKENEQQNFHFMIGIRNIIISYCQGNITEKDRTRANTVVPTLLFSLPEVREKRRSERRAAERQAAERQALDKIIKMMGEDFYKRYSKKLQFTYDSNKVVEVELTVTLSKKPADAWFNWYLEKNPRCEFETNNLEGTRVSIKIKIPLDTTPAMRLIDRR